MKFLVMPGDGIGPEIVPVAVAALEALDGRSPVSRSKRFRLVLRALRPQGTRFQTKHSPVRGTATG